MEWSEASQNLRRVIIEGTVVISAAVLPRISPFQAHNNPTHGLDDRWN